MLGIRPFPERHTTAFDRFLVSCAQYEKSHQHGPDKGQRGLILGDIFWASLPREASYPYDYIFALLGPLETTDDRNLEVDYTRPLTCVFQQAMVTIIKTTRNLDILLLKFEQGFTMEPSWYFDFRSRQDLRGWRY